MEDTADYSKAVSCIDVGSSLVDLHIKLQESCDGTWYASVLVQLLHDCQSLQVLYVNAFGYMTGAMSIVLDQCHGTGLTDLCLESVQCDVLDFSQTTSLTSPQLLQLAFPEKRPDGGCFATCFAGLTC